MSLKDTKPIELGKKSRINRIHRIGIELEGGWDNAPSDGQRIVHDGSVKNVGGNYGIGELPSPPLEPHRFEEWLRKSWPNHINATCGMHVHLSMKSALTYSRLMEQNGELYTATVLDGFERWAKKIKLDPKNPIWERLKGGSIYCQHLADADAQVLNFEKDHDKARKGHRYTVINFNWGRTGTAECRLLPMMQTSDLAIEAIHELMNITNGFLVATAKKEKKLFGEAMADKSIRDIIESRRVKVRI